MSRETAVWTIDRLARLAAAALSAGTLASQPNGRIREVPDVRTIRWYTSIGLLDRPAAMRGRTALYGRRHLAQLVAIKRLQAAGLTLTAVQERLLGADAATVERIAGLPGDVEGLVDGDELAEGAGANGTAVGAGSSGMRGRSGEAGTVGEAGKSGEAGTVSEAGKSGEAGTVGEADMSGEAGTVGEADMSREAGASGEATRDADTSSSADASAPAAGGSEGVGESMSRTKFWSARPTSSSATEPAAPAPDIAPLVSGVRLTPDVTLLLSSGRVPGPADRAAIADAARPLLDLLHRLGLTGP